MKDLVDDSKEYEDDFTLLDRAIEKIKNDKLKNILFVQQTLLKAVDDYMYKNKILRVLPLMMAPITDTLNHSVESTELIYNEQKFDVMKSMIFHKQITLINKNIEKLYIVSPNIRLEKTSKGDDRHLFEFTQVDFEFKDGTMEKVFDFVEGLVRHVFEILSSDSREELETLGAGVNHLKISVPFKRYRTEELFKKYGKDFEKLASLDATEPFWIINHKREFYDAEDLNNMGTYKNYDLIWPLGFGEALSGGEREYEYHRILTRMRELGTDEKVYRNYIELAKRGELVKTAGAGFGVERMTRFVCKQNEVDDVTIFTRKPGKSYLF